MWKLQLCFLRFGGSGGNRTLNPGCLQIIKPKKQKHQHQHQRVEGEIFHQQRWRSADDSRSGVDVRMLLKKYEKKHLLKCFIIYKHNREDVQHVSHVVPETGRWGLSALKMPLSSLYLLQTGTEETCEVQLHELTKLKPLTPSEHESLGHKTSPCCSTVPSPAPRVLSQWSGNNLLWRSSHRFSRPEFTEITYFYGFVDI